MVPRLGVVVLVMLFMMALCVRSNLSSGTVQEAESGERRNVQSARLIIDLGPEENGLPTGNSRLASLPDGHVSVVWAGGQVAMWVAAEVRSYLFQGVDLDTLRPHEVTGNGRPVPVLAPTGRGFDSDYAAFGSVLPGAQSGELLGFYHAERCDRDNYTASVGAAISTDGGVSWQRAGAVVTGRRSTDSCDKSSPRGAGQPSAVRVGDYLYLYYTDWSGDIPDEIHLARAPIGEAADPGAWQKYHRGRFSEPGIGGDSTPVITRAEPGSSTVYAANASVSYNSYLRRYLAVFTSNDGFYAATSADGITWDTPVSLPLAFPQLSSETEAGDTWYGYPSLVSPSELSHLYTSQTGYLYYAHGVDGETSHRLMRRAFRIQLSDGDHLAEFEPPAAPTTSKSLSRRDEFRLPGGGIWICSGDVEILRPDHSVAQLYDDDAGTGLVVAIEAEGTVVLIAPYGAACEAADPLGPNDGHLLDDRARALLRDGCLTGCDRVRVLKLAMDGGITMQSRWLP